jgi:hypothetical protein
MTDSKRSGSSSLRNKLRGIKPEVIESSRARGAKSRRQLGNRTQRAISMIRIYGNNFRLLSGRLLKVSLQRIVLAVKAIELGFYQPCYTEVIKFYTEPETTGYVPTERITWHDKNMCFQYS